MEQKELLKLVAGLLNRLGIKYMVTGAYSVIYYGRPRFSHDVDFVVEMEESDVDGLVRELKKASEDFIFQESAIEDAVKKRSQFDVLYGVTLDKIDFWVLEDSDFERTKFARRKEVTYDGMKVHLTSPEDTIVQKLVWYGKSKIEKHLIDAAFVWQLQERLDKKYIKEWAGKLGVEKYLPELSKINPEDHY